MRLFLSLILMLSLAATVQAATPARGEGLDAVLLSTASRDSLRKRLLAYSTHAPNARAAAMALYYRAMSFERAAQPDSAIANYRRATMTAQVPLAITALVDALLRRRNDGDAAEAIAALGTLPAVDQEPGSAPTLVDPARLGWANVLAGHPKTGLDLLAPLEGRLGKDPTWCYRYARTYIEMNNDGKALPYLLTLNSMARGQDPEIATLLGRVDKLLGPNARVRQRTMTEQQDRDDLESEMLNRLRGRRVRLKAGDGSLIGGAIFADSTSKKRLPRAALVLGSLGDDLQDYDSLTVALRKSGFSVFVLDPRGSGWSVGPEFPLPDTWKGRQDALGARVVRDVHDALNAFAHVARIDTTQVLLVGVVGMVPEALTAAAEDARFRALVLLDPLVSPVDRGATIAAAKRAQLPTYVQVSVPGRSESAFADTLFRACPPRASRYADSIALGSGAAAFGSRPEVTPRFVRWLAETYATKPARRVIPRATPPAR